MKAKDVKSVYGENQNLKEIGSSIQYYQYLKTIFPESKVKEILYHGSPNKFPEFKDPSASGLSHIWFSEKPLKGQFGENVYPVILNIKNPLSEFNNENYPKELNNYESSINPEWRNNYPLTGELPQYKYDGTIRTSRVDDGKSITVRSPDQAHILGSKKDIEGFKEFVSKKDSLEKIIVSAFFIFFAIAGLFFSTMNLTGNVISNTNQSSNIIGILLFLTGILGYFLNKK